MKRGAGFLVLTLFSLTLIFSLQIVSATFALGVPNYSIDKVYGPSQNISGWLNISFSGEPLSSIFLSTIGSSVHSINLSEILKSNTGYTKTCSPKDCGNDYSASNAGTTKTFQMSPGESNISGLRFTGNVSAITSIGFNVQSDATASCVSQLKIDLLDDGTVDFQNNKSDSGGASCLSENYGCFDPSASTEVYTLTQQYCQKVNISETPSVRVGAWIRNNSGKINVSMELHDLSGALLGTACRLPDVGADGEYYCDINYSVTTPVEYYVCIYPTTFAGDYRIRGNDQPESYCGFRGNDFGASKVGAYQIFAQAKKFADFGTTTVSNNLPNGQTLSSMAFDYLADRYGEKNGKVDCSAGCVVPIRLTSNADQTVTLGSLAVSYTKDAGSVPESSFYDVQTAPAKITSGFKKLYITNAAGFSVPSSLNNYTFSLKFNGQSVLSEKVQVKDVPIITSLEPTKTASAFPTEFVAIVSSRYNMTSFTWDFGDGTGKVTTLGNAGNTTTHTYDEIGVYTLTVNVTDQRRLSGSSTFQINVTSPADLIEIKLAELRVALRDIKSEINGFDTFTKAAINASLGLASIESSVNSLQTRYNSATTNAQLDSIVTDILKLGTLPESLSKTRSAGGLPLITTADNVNVDVLRSIAGGSNGTTGSDEDYQNAAAFWQLDKLNTRVNFTEYSGIYNGQVKPVVKTFRITVSEKTSIPYDYFLIMPKLPGFYSDSSFSTEGDYIYLNMNGKSSVSFSTTADFDFTDLPAFVSPSVSQLAVEGPTPPEEIKTSKWTIFGLVLLGLVVVGIIVYIILQQWYKRKYENHLFPVRNDLYNMAVYINNARRKGMKNGDIESNLKKAGWSAERIRYAMRKYVGKGTGMPFEISFGKKK